MKYAHECPAWDYEEIDESCREIAVCNCFSCDDEFVQLKEAIESCFERFLNVLN